MSIELKSTVQLMQGDCLERMKEIPDGSVDMILADLPYGTTSQNKWDKKIALSPLWEQYERIIKRNGAIVLFSQMPFGAELILSNRRLFRYEWIWQKTHPLGFLNANRMPLRAHENILVFYKFLPTYNAQKTTGKPYDKGMHKPNSTTNYGHHGEYICVNSTGERFPVDVVKYSNANRHNVFHPTQKPVALLEYLIKTYTNEGETVLDNVMGSGSTGVAAVNTGRKFIGIELDEKFYETAKNRIEKAIEEKTEPASEAGF